VWLFKHKKQLRNNYLFGEAIIAQTKYGTAVVNRPVAS
jgi:hypothetical protein